MLTFRIAGCYSIQQDYVAEVEIEARSLEDALEHATRLNREGRFPWKPEGDGETTVPAEFFVI